MIKSEYERTRSESQVATRRRKDDEIFTLKEIPKIGVDEEHGLMQTLDAAGQTLEAWYEILRADNYRIDVQERLVTFDVHFQENDVRTEVSTEKSLSAMPPAWLFCSELYSFDSNSDDSLFFFVSRKGCKRGVFRMDPDGFYEACVPGLPSPVSGPWNILKHRMVGIFAAGHDAEYFETLELSLKTSDRILLKRTLPLAVTFLALNEGGATEFYDAVTYHEGRTVTIDTELWLRFLREIPPLLRLEDFSEWSLEVSRATTSRSKTSAVLGVKLVYIPESVDESSSKKEIDVVIGDDGNV